jgi:agmatine/peptidylarginine deiminase
LYILQRTPFEQGESGGRCSFVYRAILYVKFEMGDDNLISETVKGCGGQASMEGALSVLEGGALVVGG